MLTSKMVNLVVREVGPSVPARLDLPGTLNSGSGILRIRA